ncbi:uncharacterized protein LOC130896407 isoform X4 [Diorhabda carinulata]|uniref:uncharacterized protein LOC130449429 isoform X2 n=1 Tax=Diorhabda sublineata TaxID=1163346 RepID=UPI0024E12B1A|nr:uncharacterized protein LOC130449429 isoform X2 [Diorhabda sublineata]XP_057660447.1 uncharacterized protein LOC130896407 isoform X4 [Diorhabda carinulata]
MPVYLEFQKIKFKDPTTLLKIVVVIHYLLSVLGAIGSFNPFVYLFYNFVVIFLLIWSIYGKNDEPLKLAIVINMCSIILDALYIVALADDLSGFRNSLSAAASLIHLIFRPFSILLLIKKEEKRNIPIDTVCSRESG